jgi:hypothetical protein
MSDKIKGVLFVVSAILILAGAIMHVALPTVASYIFAVGSVGVAVYYFTIPVKDLDLRSRRLQRFNIFAGMLCLASSVLMFAHRKEWVICLTIAAIFQLYSAFITPKKKSN